MEANGIDMGKLDLNLDAYRLIADLLHRLRKTVRQELQAKAGDGWHELIPEDLRLFLTQRRQREQSVSWFHTDNADLLDYAAFADLAEILASQPDLLEKLDWLPLSGREAMLRVRFMELDTIFQRVAYARPVGELELELLSNLGERVKKSLEPKEKTEGTSSSAPPSKFTTPPPAVAPRQEAKAKPAPTPAAAPAVSNAPTNKATELQQALTTGDIRTIMQALYREVVATADTIFKEGRSPACPVWEAVRESAWYAENFRRLSLAPLSHFFDIVEDAKELARQAPREDVLEAVRNRGFAQTLLQLRELFQPYL